jgi:hypothetical protein
VVTNPLRDNVDDRISGILHRAIRYKEGYLYVIPVPAGCTRQPNVRQAWEIGLNDPDAVGVYQDDSPLVPERRDNAPVIELLAWKRSRKASRK